MSSTPSWITPERRLTTGSPISVGVGSQEVIPGGTHGGRPGIVPRMVLGGSPEDSIPSHVTSRKAIQSPRYRPATAASVSTHVTPGDGFGDPSSIPAMGYSAIGNFLPEVPLSRRDCRY